jgi:hypothetical protein
MVVNGGEAEIGADVVAGTVGGLAVMIFASEIDEALVAKRQADVRPSGELGSIVDVTLAIIECAEIGVGRIGRRVDDRQSRAIQLQPGQLHDMVDGREVPPGSDHRAAAVIGVLELDVDHARDRIGAILRCGAIAEHLDPADRDSRDQVEVDRRASSADGAIDVEQRRDVAALAVDQHQRLVGAEPRSVAGRSASEPSAIDGAGKLNDGTSVLRMRLVSVWPLLLICSAPMTSTGTGLLATVRWWCASR